ncbi:MAG: DUF1476 domain-containing protein [Rhodothalassiaceae bacterium]
MTSFDEREQAFEKKFAHDEELRFKVGVRRNKLLGLWAATEFGLSGAEAEAYAKEVIESDFEEVGTDDVLRKLAKDFAARRIEISRHRLERQLQECAEEARRQIMNETA